MTNGEPRGPAPQSRQAGHELSDVSPGGIFWFALGLVVALLAVAMFLVWLFGFFDSRAAREDTPPSPIARPELPPEPRLQVAPWRDIDQMRDRENSILQSYGWISQEDRLVRIPIDRALEHIAEHGLPDWPVVQEPARPRESNTPPGTQNEEQPR